MVVKSFPRKFSPKEIISFMSCYNDRFSKNTAFDGRVFPPKAVFIVLCFLLDQAAGAEVQIRHFGLGQLGVEGDDICGDFLRG